MIIQFLVIAYILYCCIICYLARQWRDTESQWRVNFGDDDEFLELI